MLGKSILVALACAVLTLEPAQAEDETTAIANCQKFAKRLYSVRDFQEDSRDTEDGMALILFNVTYQNRLTGLDAPATIHCMYFIGENGFFYFYDIAYNRYPHIPIPRGEQGGDATEQQYRDYLNLLLDQYYDYLDVTYPELTYKERNALAQEWLDVVNSPEE